MVENVTCLLVLWSFAQHQTEIFHSSELLCCHVDVAHLSDASVFVKENYIDRDPFTLGEIGTIDTPDGERLSLVTLHVQLDDQSPSLMPGYTGEYTLCILSDLYEHRTVSRIDGDFRFPSSLDSRLSLVPVGQTRDRMFG